MQTRRRGAAAVTDVHSPLQGCGSIVEDQVKIVLGPDMRPSGEAYVEIVGPDAQLRNALAKDRQVMPVRASKLCQMQRSDSSVRLSDACLQGSCSPHAPSKSSLRLSKAAKQHNFTQSMCRLLMPVCTRRRTPAGTWRSSPATRRSSSGAS